MQRKTLSIIALAGIFLLNACNGTQSSAPTVPPQPTVTASPQPTATTKPQQTSCIVGSWQLQNFDSVLQTMLTNALGQTGKIGTINSSGSLQYTLTQTGEITTMANAFKAKVPVTVNDISLNVEIDFNGSARANYSLDEANQTITYKNFDLGNLKITALVNGKSVGKQIDPAGLMLGAAQKAAHAQYQCQGNTLQVTLQAKEANGKSIILSRINQ